MNEPPSIPASVWEVIFAHAEESFPAECCGMVLGAGNSVTRARRCTNAQNKYHQLDPVNFPRDERKAYFIEPTELLAMEKEMRANGERIVAIYHSHPDAEAYFSREDQAQAIANGEPLYPGAFYLVLSVREGVVKGSKCFAWDGARYEELPSVESD